MRVSSSLSLTLFLLTLAVSMLRGIRVAGCARPSLAHRFHYRDVAALALQQGSTPRRLRRLAQEHADLSTSLPCTPSSSVWCRPHAGTYVLHVGELPPPHACASMSQRAIQPRLTLSFLSDAPCFVRVCCCRCHRHQSAWTACSLRFLGPKTPLTAGVSFCSTLFSPRTTRRAARK